MSVYSTPNSEILDEGTSCSEDSVYATPETSFTDSVSDSCPLASDSFDWKLKEMNDLSIPLTEGTIYQEKMHAFDCILGKENIDCSPAKSKYCRKSDEETTLKCITALLNSNESCQRTLPFESETDVLSELHVKTDVSPKILNFDEKNIVVCKSTRGNLLRRVKLLQKLKPRYNALKDILHLSNKMSVGEETTLIQMGKSNYGSISCENEGQEINESSSEQKSAKLPSQPLSFSVLKKCRFINLKRLFRRSIGSVRSCYLKYLPNLRGKGYQSVDPRGGVMTHYSTNEQPTFGVDLEKLTQQSSNTKELLTTVILKLSSVESELRELKNLVKENNSRGSSLVPPPPPPPPPPLPPPFPSSTPKRKADVTTPENQQLAKRPSRVVEQRAQFSVTVEDLRNVKLRKTGNPATKKNNIEKNAVMETTSLPSSARAVGFRFKRNRAVDKELSEIAAELLSPRAKDNSAKVTPAPNRSPLVDAFTDPNIYEQTPKRPKRGNSMFSCKRKEALNKSPARKRLNSCGLSSPNSHKSSSDIPGST